MVGSWLLTKGDIIPAEFASKDAIASIIL